MGTAHLVNIVDTLMERKNYGKKSKNSLGRRKITHIGRNNIISDHVMYSETQNKQFEVL